MKKQVIMVAAALSLALSGCNGGITKDLNIGVNTNKAAEETPEEELLQETKQEVQPEAEVWSEEEDLALYNAYIDINNYMVGRLNDSLTRYFDYVEYQEEFVNKKKDYYCYSIGESKIKKVEDTYAIVEAKSEKTELDEAFLKMHPFLVEVMGCLNDIYTYTDMKSYLDDDYGKGKELHAVLWNSVNEYTETGDVFMAAVTKESDIRREAGLQKLKEEGYEMLYTINCVMDSAQAIQEELFNEEIDNENILDMDLEVIKPLYKEFAANVEKVMELAEDKEKLEEEGFQTSDANWSFFQKSMKNTKTSMTMILDKVREGEPLSHSDTLIGSISGNCSITSFYTGISEMIGYYNSMIR